jgi:perosamine synthetase
MYWKERCIDFNSNVSLLLDRLQKSEGSVLYIIDDESRLKGTVTDGDLRRFLIANPSCDVLKETAGRVMNESFVYENVGEVFKREFDEYRKYKEIPLCDFGGRLIDVISIEKDDFIPIAAPSLGRLEKQYLNECFDSDFISSNSSMVASFERSFLNTVNAEYGTSVSNGTVALELIIRSLDLKPGSCIGVPNYTFAASINAIINCGFVPLILDCREDLLLDESMVPWSRLDALIYVSIYGNAFNIELVRDLAKENNVFLIGDHAEGLGCMVNEEHIGNYCDAASYSFFANKLITTGEGGFITFNRKDLLDKALVIKNHGMNPKVKYDHIEVGGNYRMTGLQASIGLAQLERYSEFLTKRQVIGNNYFMAISAFKHDVRPMSQTINHVGSFWLYPLIVEESKLSSLENILSESRIEIRRIFQPLCDMPIYTPFIEAGTVYRRFHGVVLPTHPGLTMGHVTKIINIINKWVKQLQ